MTGPTGEPTGGVAPGARQPIDVLAVLAAMQDQLDDLAATVEAQQRTIDAMARSARPTGAAAARSPGRSGNGRR